jgi:anti-anti-sigma factor
MQPGRGRLVSVSVPARIEQRDPVGVLLVAACRGEVPGERGEVIGNQVVSAFNEAFNNAVLHAYEDVPEGTVEVSLDRESGCLVLEVADHGRSFDPQVVATPDLDSLPEGGLGVYIMRSLMNEVHYQAGDPNVLRLVKHIGGEHSPLARRPMLEHHRVDRNDVSLLSLKGSLNALTAPEIKPDIDALVAEKRLKVAVDLAELELIDSSGVGAIVSLFKRIRMIGGDVKIAALRGQPKEIFRILRLEKAFDLVPTVADAEARFGK